VLIDPTAEVSVVREVRANVVEAEAVDVVVGDWRAVAIVEELPAVEKVSAVLDGRVDEEEEISDVLGGRVDEEE
jgi:hypothetical protein